MTDLAQARMFLDTLDENDTFTFQTIGEAPDNPTKHQLNKVLHGPFAQHSSELTSLNGSGAGVFVMVNEGNGVRQGASCRTNGNVIRVRSLFVDLDGAPLQPVLMAAEKPDWVVESSQGRWHAYWLVEDCPLTEFRALQQAIAAKFGGDKSVCDLARVMRIPGFLHRKKEEPHLSRLYLPEDFSSLLKEPQ